MVSHVFTFELKLVQDYGYPKLQKKHNPNAVDVIEEMKTIVQKFGAWKQHYYKVHP